MICCCFVCEVARCGVLCLPRLTTQIPLVTERISTRDWPNSLVTLSCTQETIFCRFFVESSFWQADMVSSSLVISSFRLYQKPLLLLIQQQKQPFYHEESSCLLPPASPVGRIWWGWYISSSRQQGQEGETRRRSGLDRGFVVCSHNHLVCCLLQCAFLTCKIIHCRHTAPIVNNSWPKHCGHPFKI